MVDLDIAPSILYLWAKRTLYIGHYNGFREITQGTASLIFGLDGDIEITHVKTGKKCIAQSFLVPAGESYAIASHGGRIANCFLDVCSEDFPRLKRYMRGSFSNIYFNYAAENMSLSTIYRMIDLKLDQKEAKKLLHNMLYVSDNDMSAYTSVDPRVVVLVGLIRRDPTVTHTGEFLANSINVSETTMQRLFKAATGVTVRRFRLWHRLFLTASLVADGHSITEAAIDSGFSDASHFNHVFKEMIGMSPSSIMKMKRKMKIYAERSNACFLGERFFPALNRERKVSQHL